MSRSSRQKTERCLEARNERGFTLIELLIVVAIIGQTVGPFLSPVPSAPTGRTPYTAGYVANLAARTYRLSTSGDSVVVSVP